VERKRKASRQEKKKKKKDQWEGRDVIATTQPKGEGVNTPRLQVPAHASAQPAPNPAAQPAPNSAAQPEVTEYPATQP